MNTAGTPANAPSAVRLNARLARQWSRLTPEFLPFADAVSPGLPLARLLRLALFQVSVGMAAALLVGTLNRVMILELGVPAWLVALMVALPLLAAPFRAVVGHRSDTHRSLLGWRRVPYLWMGTLLQFGGLAILPFSLILLSSHAGVADAARWTGLVAALAAFLMVGAGMQTTQTAGLALATDQATPETRPRVVALMYVMLLLGMVGASAVFSLVLASYTPTRLVGVVQGAASVTLLLNLVALWKQEPRTAQHNTDAAADASAIATPREPFRQVWQRYAGRPHTLRFLVTLALGTAAFSMQDIVLEPYGGEILHLSVSATSLLTAMMALGSVGAFVLATRWLPRGVDPHRLAALGLLIGIVAFSAVVFAAPLGSGGLFRAGNLLIGLGSGLFSVCTLVIAMGMARDDGAGLALGAWGAVQATAAGVAVALGGTLRDAVHLLGTAGWLGEAMSEPQVAYSVVYHTELALLFATLVAIGPLVRREPRAVDLSSLPNQRLGLAEFPG
ncbi:BCD family MFS transporter [Sphaerotilus mobilis]|uniref:BCD family chlorophyll transporter-like MFS transporter n=1 Tax=Sphaerotilus mobilis TaxID=47994 RepID=A0A4Q7LWP8_9BURK|nr:BCD family MFS transporter [Sphaerotilus mobilis]RZS58558.1 BCD family chlorophyll transporter-like MFS transporter [Sphaerotilus mobilis]